MALVTTDSWQWFLKYDEKFGVVYIFVPQLDDILVVDPEQQQELLREDIRKVSAVFQGLCVGGTTPVIWATPMVKRANRLLVGLYRVEDLSASKLLEASPNFGEVDIERVTDIPTHIGLRFDGVPKPLIQRCLELHRTLRSLASEDGRAMLIDTTNLQIQQAVYSEGVKTKELEAPAKTGVRVQAQRKGRSAGRSKESGNEWKEMELEELLKHYDSSKNGKVEKNEVEAILKHLNCKLDKKHVIDQLKKCDTDKDGSLDVEEFISFYHTICGHPEEVQEIVQDLFRKACAGADSVDLDALFAFVNERHSPGCVLSVDEVGKIMRQFDVDGDPDGALCFGEFLSFILSAEDNSIMEPVHLNRVHEDMSRPLAHYFVSSTHNTYLTGNQLTSDSSADAVAAVLKAGARVVELDCYDGKDGQPFVKHGGTMTKPVGFRECVKAVAEFAFHRSQYPMILTLENHCSKEQQKLQASILREELGDALFEPDQCGLAEFMSPEELKGRVLIRDKPRKVKKQGGGHSEEEGNEEDEEDCTHDVEEEYDCEPELLRLMYIQNVTFSPSLLLTERGETSCGKHAHGASSHSFSETKLGNLAAADGKFKDVGDAGLREYSQRHLLRVFPAGTRVDSSNYDPQEAWECGCQVVALNYQTKNRAVWIDRGKFSANGGCGWVAKPQWMLGPAGGSSSSQPMRLSLVIVSAHRLPKPEGRLELSEVIDPYVCIELGGSLADSSPCGLAKKKGGKSKEVKTDVVQDNGFNPYWGQTFEFHLLRPELATMLLTVRDQRLMGHDMMQPDFIGQYALPVASIRQGYRAVPIKNKEGAVHRGASLFVQVTLRPL
jgi:Ca2+-binding EF-hand superfamily protein